MKLEDCQAASQSTAQVSKGAWLQAVQMDVWVTADQVPVMSRDDNLQRLTGKPILISEVHMLKHMWACCAAYVVDVVPQSRVHMPHPTAASSQL